MMRILVIWNIAVTLVLAGLLWGIASLHKEVEVGKTGGIIRTRGLEVIDSSGKTKAALEPDPSGSSSSELVFYDNEGRRAAFLSLNSKGYGTLYFQNKQTEGKVSVGYLWGSDTPTPPAQEDPLSSWGIRVRGPNGEQSNFGLLNSGQPIGQNIPNRR